MRPSDLPELRDRQLGRFAEATAGIAAASKKAEAGYLTVGPGPARIAKHLAGLRDIVCGPAWTETHWRMADLFFVTSEMATLAGSAAGSMPGFELHPDDLPSPSGVMYFDVSSLSLTFADNDPIEAFDLVVVWGPDHSGSAGNIALTFLTRNPREPVELMRIMEVALRWGDDPIAKVLQGHSEEAATWAGIVRCTWLLMQQRVAAVDVARPDRASARRILRRGGSLDAVRVIRLRYAAGPPREPGESDRVYSHRWVVRGHWRKQWYASQGRHVPIWISPFVKGPDGAPLLGGEKVYAWTR